MALPRKEIARRKFLGTQRAEVAYLIVHEMKKRGYNMRKLSQTIGITIQAVSLTINGKQHSPRVLGAILNLGISPDLLYDPRQTMPTAKRGA